MGGVIINSEGDEIQMETVKETGTYIDLDGVGRWLNVGDPLPSGWTLQGEPEETSEKTSTKRKRGPAANKAKAPAEDKAKADDKAPAEDKAKADDKAPAEDK